MTVLITGARGSIGRAVLHQLHAAGVPVRAGSKATDPAVPADVRTAVVDLTDPTGLPAALDGVTKVFLYAPQHGADKVATCLRDSSVEHVVVLSSSSVERPDTAISAHHREVEQAVRETGRDWTMLRPGAFASNTLGWAGDVRTGTVLVPYPDSWIEPIHEADVADAAVAALTGPGHTGREYLLSGGESITQRRQIELIGEAIGRRLDVVALTDEQWRERVSPFMPDVAIDSLLDLWRAAADRPGPCDATITDITGAPPRSFATWAHDHRESFV